MGIQGGLRVGKRGRAKVWGKWVRHKGEGLRLGIRRKGLWVRKRGKC